MGQENDKSAVIYRVQFKTDEQYYDLYVKHVYPADMAGFICLENFLFQEENAVIINPRNERLASEFAAVETAFIPYYQIVRIDQVSKAGQSRMQDCDGKGKVRRFPIEK